MKNGAGTTQIEWLFIAAVVALSIIGLSALLQASVWLANKVIGGRESAVLTPGVRRAMLIALVTMAVEFILNYLVEGLSGVRANGGELKSPDDLSKLAAYGALSLIAGFIAWCSTLTFALPTPFVRAALVTFFLHLLSVALAVVVAAPLAVAFVLLTG